MGGAQSSSTVLQEQQRTDGGLGSEHVPQVRATMPVALVLVTQATLAQATKVGRMGAVCITLVSQEGHPLIILQPPQS